MVKSSDRRSLIKWPRLSVTVKARLTSSTRFEMVTFGGLASPAVTKLAIGSDWLNTPMQSKGTARNTTTTTVGEQTERRTKNLLSRLRAFMPGLRETIPLAQEES